MQDPRIGRQVTWNVDSIQYIGTVIKAFLDFDGQELLAVKITQCKHGTAKWSPDLHNHAATIFPPNTPDFGNAQYVD